MNQPATPSIPSFESNNVTDWYRKGGIKTLNCRLGNVNIFCIDDPCKTPQSSTQPPTLLFIHGFPTSSYDFGGMWPHLNQRFRLVTLDMLGFGFSDKPDNRHYTIHQQADLFESLVRELNLDSFHVVAHDYGLSVAQELLARQLEGAGHGKWLSCSLLNGGLFPETHRALFIQKLMLSRLGKWVNKLAGITQFSDSFSRVFGTNSRPNKTELAEFWEIITHNNGRHVFHNLITYMHDRKQHRSRWLHALQTSTVPMALINGSIDPVSGSHLVQRYQELDCRLDYLKELEEIGHYPHVEAPEVVTNALLEFIQSVATQASVT